MLYTEYELYDNFSIDFGFMTKEYYAGVTIDAIVSIIYAVINIIFGIVGIVCARNKTKEILLITLGIIATTLSSIYVLYLGYGGLFYKIFYDGVTASLLCCGLIVYIIVSVIYINIGHNLSYLKSKGIKLERST
jgi:hypothetical protein